MTYQPAKSTPRLADKFNFDPVRDYAGFKSEIKQLLRGHRDLLSGIDCIVIHVHADELLGQGLLHVASELHRVVQSLVGVVESVLNAFAHQAAAFALDLRIERPKQRVRAEGQGKVIGLLPPTAKVQNVVETTPAERKLCLMNDESRIDNVVSNGIRDSIERKDDGFERNRAR
jgi:hypothetical protein